nr:hypothetical protein BaRGS_026726 [Batillaria attramentaria]
MVSETERADIPRIPRKQRRPRYVYLMPLDQQLAWSMPSLFFLMIGVAMTVACAAWPTWFSGVRNVNGTIEIGYLSSTKVCKENNLTRLVTCFTYAEEFDGTTPSAITFFWVGLGYLLVCCAIGISASEWFLIQSQDPEHLKLTNWALRASALSAIPIFPLKSWAAIYYNVNHSTSAGPYLILVALSSVALAYCFTSFSTRQICVFMDDRMERMVESRDKPSIFRRFAARPATVVTGRKAAGGEQKGMVRIVRDAAKGKVKRRSRDILG